jgi:hypothetical protein
MNQAEHMAADADVLARFDNWADSFAAHVAAKGVVPPGEFRAFGYKAPSHRLADVKLKWRELRMRTGLPRADSSPARQQALNLTDDPP